MLKRLLGIALCFMALGPTGILGDEPRIAVIVHPERHAELSTEELAQIYLRRKRFWNDGDTIVPLNLPFGAPLRTRFSKQVLHLTEARLADYWNRQYFQGILPPTTLASTEAVRRYVASEPNAIGYLPVSEVDESVRVILHLGGSEREP